MGREVIFLHFGQAGVQMASALWELFCHEHQINPAGEIIKNEQATEVSISENIGAFFQEGTRSWSPRALLIDLEPTVVDEIRVGPYQKLWKPGCLITGQEDAANNYGRGCCTIGKQKMMETLCAVRKLTEETNNFSAFEILHSYSGGTGSGMTSLIIEQLCDEYGKKFKFSTSVFPSPMYSQSTVDPYNAILHAHATIETLDCAILFDNQTMLHRCEKNLGIHRASYTEINRLLAQMLSSIFLSHRFIYSGSQHCDTTELLTNLIPYPRIHFPSLYYAPLLSHHVMHHDAVTVGELTRAVFSEGARTIDFPSNQNSYISCAMMYRGVSSPKQVYDALQLVKGSPSLGANFVDWCPTGFKIGLNHFPPMTFPDSPLAETSRSVCMLAGNLGMRHAWHRNNAKFDILFSRRSFVHWFVGEGIEENEFIEARDDLAYLEQDYAELMSDTIQAVEMVEPSSNHEERKSKRSSGTESFSQSQAGPDSTLMEEEEDEEEQSNNANNNKRSTDTKQHIQTWEPRYPTVDRYGDVGSEDSTTQNQLDEGQSLDCSKLSNQTCINNRFSYGHAAGDEWTDAELDTNEVEVDYVNRTDGKSKNCTTHENSKSYHTIYRPTCGDYGPKEFASPGPTLNESLLRTTEISQPHVPRGTNMNNARHSQATTEAGFSPTEPVVKNLTDFECVSSAYSLFFQPPGKSNLSEICSTSNEANSETTGKRTKKLCRKHQKPCLLTLVPGKEMSKGKSKGSTKCPATSAISNVDQDSSSTRTQEEDFRETDGELYRSSDPISTDMSCVVENLDYKSESEQKGKNCSTSSGLGSLTNISHTSTPQLDSHHDVDSVWLQNVEMFSGSSRHRCRKHETDSGKKHKRAHHHKHNFHRTNSVSNTEPKQTKGVEPTNDNAIHRVHKRETNRPKRSNDDTISSTNTQKSIQEVSVIDDYEDRALTPVLSAWTCSVNAQIPTQHTTH